MTAVARIAIKDCPMLVADLLLSGPPLPGVMAVIPTADDLSVAFPAGSVMVPRDLGQKIAVVADNLVVGWAGTYDIARAVVSELVRLSGMQAFTNESLQRHFDSLSPSVWSEIGLVGFVRDGKGIAQFGHSYDTLSTQIFGTVGLLGTGRGDIEAFLGKFAQLLVQKGDRRAAQVIVMQGHYDMVQPQRRVVPTVEENFLERVE